MFATKEAEAKTRKLWEARIEEQKASGLGVADFCKRKGIKESGFNYWTVEIGRLARIATMEKEDAAKRRQQKDDALVESYAKATAVPMMKPVDAASVVVLAPAPEAAPVAPPPGPFPFESQKPGKKSSPEKRAFWVAHVKACDAGVLTASDYCRNNGIDYDQFIWWRRRVEGPRPKVVKEPATLFVAADDMALSSKSDDVFGWASDRIQPAVERKSLGTFADVVGKPDNDYLPAGRVYESERRTVADRIVGCIESGEDWIRFKVQGGVDGALMGAIITALAETPDPRFASRSE